MRPTRMRRAIIFLQEEGGIRRRVLGPREYAGMDERGQAERSRDGAISSA
jgi:hypothetical protein